MKKAIVYILAVHAFMALIFLMSCNSKPKTEEVELNETNYIDPAEMTDDGYTYIDSLINAGVAIGDTDEGV